MDYSLILNIAAAGAEGADSAGTVAELAGKFGIDIQLIIAQIVNFGLVVFLLYKFAFKPVIKTMDERQQKISDGLQYAEEMKSKLSEAEKTHAETLKQAQQEAQEILVEARKQSKEYFEQQTQEATSKVEAMLEKGREANERERNKMLSEVRQEVAHLVVQATGKVLRKELSDDEKSRYNESAAKEIANLN